MKQFLGILAILLGLPLQAYAQPAPKEAIIFTQMAVTASGTGANGVYGLDKTNAQVDSAWNALLLGYSVSGLDIWTATKVTGPSVSEIRKGNYTTIGLPFTRSERDKEGYKVAWAALQKPGIDSVRAAHMADSVRFGGGGPDTIIPISKGGTGAMTAADARANLGLSGVVGNVYYRTLRAADFTLSGNVAYVALTDLPKNALIVRAFATLDSQFVGSGQSNDYWVLSKVPNATDIIDNAIAVPGFFEGSSQPNLTSDSLGTLSGAMSSQIYASPNQPIYFIIKGNTTFTNLTLGKLLLQIVIGSGGIGPPSDTILPASGNEGQLFRLTKHQVLQGPAGLYAWQAGRWVNTEFIDMVLIHYSIGFQATGFQQLYYSDAFTFQNSDASQIWYWTNTTDADSMRIWGDDTYFISDDTANIYQKYIFDPTGHVTMALYSQNQHNVDHFDIGNWRDIQYLDLHGQHIPQSEVNALLIAIDGFGTSNVTVRLDGGTNGAPSGTGITAMNNIIGRGGSVLHN